MHPLPTLLHSLQASTWRRLLAMMDCHGLACSTRWSKAQLVAALHAHLLQPQTVNRLLANLAPSLHCLLQSLLAADGQLPAVTLQEHFGKLRPYRPWDRSTTSPRTPWQTPHSPVERLWYWGLIYFDPPKVDPHRPQQALIPGDLLPLLRTALSLPPQTTLAQAHPRPGAQPDLLWQLSLWLATLVEQAQPPQAHRPLKGGWLSPSLLTLQRQRLGLTEADPSPSHSERAHPYLAFLHLLARTSQLLEDQTHFRLTPVGWQWLQSTPEQRWQQLWHDWLQAPDDLLRPFFFAWGGLSAAARKLIADLLRQQPVNQWLPLTYLTQQIRLHDRHFQLVALPRSTDEEGNPLPFAEDAPLTTLCQEPLFWLGLLDLAVEGGTFYVRLTAHGGWLLQQPDWGAPTFAPPQPCTLLSRPPNTLRIPVTTQPQHLLQLLPFCRWLPGDPRLPALELQLDPERIAQSVAMGSPLAQIFALLQQATEQAPGWRLQQRLRHWAEAGNAVRIRPLLILESKDAHLMGQLRSRSLLRRYLDQPLSPTRTAIQPDHLPALQQTLRTLGYYTDLPDAPSPAAAEWEAEPTALLWLLIQSYQLLGEHLQLPLPLPAEWLQTIRQQLSHEQQRSAESMAARLREQLDLILQGYLQMPLYSPVEQAGNIQSIIEAAIAQHQDLQITYWSGTRDEKLSRRITPYYLETRKGTPYLIAWCHLRQSERVFRLDRIEKGEIGD